MVVPLALWVWRPRTLMAQAVLGVVAGELDAQCIYNLYILCIMAVRLGYFFMCTCQTDNLTIVQT